MTNTRAIRDIESVEADPLLPRKLDLSKAVGGKYYDRMQEGTNIVLLAPDLMEAFPDSMPSTTLSASTRPSPPPSVPSRMGRRRSR